MPIEQNQFTETHMIGKQGSICKPFISTCSHVYKTKRYKETTWKSSCFENHCFRTFMPYSVYECGRNCQKEHLHTKTFHLRPLPRPYYHPLQGETACKTSCFEKPLFLDILAKFGKFQWSILAKTVKRHIYRPRPFIWAYSQVSTTIRYKDTAWKIDDGRTHGQTDGHPESIGPQPLGLGPKKRMKNVTHQ